jgi:hypothetical protein
MAVPFVSRKGARENKGAALHLNHIHALAPVTFIGCAESFFTFAPLRETNGTSVKSL